MLKENVREGMMVCNAYSQHIKVVKILDNGQIACSDGYAWEAEDLDVANHTYSHLTESRR